MNTFHPITKEKMRLTKIARKIREIKDDLHLKGIWPEVNGKSAAELQKQLGLLKYVFRHRHMAYCLVRGNSVAKIESGNPLKGKSWDLINIFRMELYEQINDYYRDMVEFLIDDNKKKDRDVMKLHMVKHVWELYLNDDENDFIDSTVSLMDTMNFILYGPPILDFKEIGGPVKHIELSLDADEFDVIEQVNEYDDFEILDDVIEQANEDDFEILEDSKPFGQIVDDEILEDVIEQAFCDALDNHDDIIELTDEVIIGTPDGVLITSTIKCACCGGTSRQCLCPEICLPECAECHRGNGNCVCDDDCPFEGEYCNNDYPCSIRMICDFFGKDFHDCETYKTRDPNSHNLKC